MFQKKIAELQSENDCLNEKLKLEEQKRIAREKANSVSKVLDSIYCKYYYKCRNLSQVSGTFQNL